MAALEDTKSASRFSRLENFNVFTSPLSTGLLQPDQQKPLNSDETTQVKEYKGIMQLVSSLSCPALPSGCPSSVRTLHRSLPHCPPTIKNIGTTRVFIVLTANSSRCFFISPSLSSPSSRVHSLSLVHSIMASNRSTAPLSPILMVHAAARPTTPALEAPTGRVAHLTTTAATPQRTVSPPMVVKLPMVNVPTRPGTL